MLFKLTLVERPDGKWVFNGTGPLELFWEYGYAGRKSFITKEAAEVFLVRFHDKAD